jgi:ABC-type multidrug transport system ATPase subunit
VDAAVEPGATVVVLGRNGAGKSPCCNWRPACCGPCTARSRERPPIVGWVPERFPADQPFTTEQYLTHMAAVRGLRGGAGIDRWIERLGLGEHRHTRLADLSKGTAQKVGLAQALLVAPGLLVLDEPWEGLDSVARALIPQLVGEVTAAGGSGAGQRPSRRDRRPAGRDPLDRHRRHGSPRRSSRRVRTPTRWSSRSRSAGRTPT